MGILEVLDNEYHLPIPLNVESTSCFLGKLQNSLPLLFKFLSKDEIWDSLHLVLEVNFLGVVSLIRGKVLKYRRQLCL